jgi:hypothetical protein
MPQKAVVFADLIAQASKPQPEKKPSTAQEKEAADIGEDFPTILTSVLALVFSALSMPEEMKPNKDELGAVSYHATRIMLRHIDVTNKLNADALDIIGILSTGAGWYMRVSPTLKPAQFFGAKPEPQPQPDAIEPATDPGARMNDSASAAFLQRSATLANERLN